MTTAEQIVESYTESLQELKMAIRTQGELLATINGNIQLIDGKLKTIDHCCTEMAKTHTVDSKASSPQEEKQPLSVSGADTGLVQETEFEQMQRQLRDLQQQNQTLQRVQFQQEQDQQQYQQYIASQQQQQHPPQMGFGQQQIPSGLAQSTFQPPAPTSRTTYDQFRNFQSMNRSQGPAGGKQ